MRVYIKFYTSNGITEKNVNGANNLFGNPTWAADEYGIAFGLNDNDSLIRAMSTQVSGISFNVLPRGGLEKLSFDVSVDLSQLNLSYMDHVKFTVGQKSYVGFLNRIDPNYDASGESVRLEVVGYAFAKGNRYTLYDKTPDDYNGDLLKKTPTEVIAAAVNKAANGNVPYLKYSAAKVVIDPAHNGLVHVAFYEQDWFDVVNKMLDIVNSYMTPADIEAGKVYVWDIDSNGYVCVYKNAVSTVDTITLPAKPFRLSRSEHVTSYSISRGGANDVENCWWVSYEGRKIDEDGRLLMYATSIKPGTQLTYSAWSINQFGGKAGVLSLSFVRGSDEAQRFVNTYAPFLCVPSRTITVGLRQLATMPDVRNSAQVTTVGDSSLNGVYPYSAIRYTLSVENDLSCDVDMGLDRRGVLQQIMQIRQEQYHRLTHREDWGHSSNPSHMDGNNIYKGDNAKQAALYAPSGGGANYNVFAPWMIAEHVSNKYYAVGFQEASGAMLYARYNESNYTWEPYMRVLPFVNSGDAAIEFLNASGVVIGSIKNTGASSNIDKIQDPDNQYTYLKVDDATGNLQFYEHVSGTTSRLRFELDKTNKNLNYYDDVGNKVQIDSDGTVARKSAGGTTIWAINPDGTMRGVRIGFKQG